MRIIVHGTLEQVTQVTPGPLVVQVTSVSDPYANRKGTPRLHRVYLEAEVTGQLDPITVRRVFADRTAVPAQTLPGGHIIPAHPAYSVTVTADGGARLTVGGDSFALLRALLEQMLLSLDAIDPIGRVRADHEESSWPVALLDYDTAFRPRGEGGR